MIRLRHKLFVYAMRGLDPAILFGTLLLIAGLVEPNPSSRSLKQILWEAYRPIDALGITTLAIGWLITFNALVHYEADRFTALRSELIDVAKAASASALLLLIVSTAFSFGRIDNKVIILVWGSSTILSMVSRIAARGFLMFVRRSGYNYRHLIIVGYNSQALNMAARIDRLPELGYKIVGFVTEDPPESSDLNTTADYPILGGLKDIQSVLENGTVDEMIICLAIREHVDPIFKIVRLAQELGIVVRLFPDTVGTKILTRFHLECFDGDYVVTLFREQLLLQLLGKRLLDGAASFFVIAVLSPLLLIVALAIKLTSRGPVLFVQKRVGMNKRTFDLYKFRSMYLDAETRRHELTHLNEMDGPVFKIKNDPRVTPVGRFIRKTSIDELPQLINVLRGHMSLVGPRPPLAEEVERYEWLYRRRLSIKPGITCLWQISGRNRISFKQWMELDQEYIDNWSLWLDIKILAKTIPAVLSLRGAS
jgi:exopolysaccharide biosynthesis polyprenyl glycosylphosphotransferase